MMRFSVIIPTLNRCELLNDAVASVRVQSFSSDEFEIIVVDNGSTDGTRELIEGLNQDSSKSIRYVYEPRPGLHWARHAGARAAKGEILAFTDDDAVAHRDWLKELDRAYIQLNADCAGGKIIIQWDQTPPSWIIPYEGVLGRLDHGPEMRLLQPGEYINGGNFSIKRRRLFEIGGFNPDQIGDRLVGDGETGLVRKIHQAGWKIAWVPGAVVWHRQIVEKNANLWDMKRRFANNGVCEAYAYYRQTMCRQRHLLRRAVSAAIKALYEKLCAFRHMYVQNAAYYQCELTAAFFWSQARHYLRLALSERFRQIVLRKDWISEPEVN